VTQYDEVIEQCADLFSEQIGVSATFKPDETSTESSWTTLQVVPGLVQEAYLQQDGEIESWVRTLEIHYRPDDLSRRPHRGDVFALATAPWTGAWIVETVEHAILGTARCIDAAAAGIRSMEAHRR
jgi:uncharacterized protein YqgV (UPF0045/DUF77 family)